MKLVHNPLVVNLVADSFIYYPIIDLKVNYWIAFMWNCPDCTAVNKPLWFIITKLHHPLTWMKMYHDVVTFFVIRIHLTYNQGGVLLPIVVITVWTLKHMSFIICWLWLLFKAFYWATGVCTGIWWEICTSKKRCVLLNELCRHMSASVCQNTYWLNFDKMSLEYFWNPWDILYLVRRPFWLNQAFQGFFTRGTHLDSFLSSKKATK